MFSSCWFVYGLRKVLLGKEILILSGNSDVNKRNLISGIRLTYKVVTPDIKRKQNNVFWNFWNIGLVLVTLINWLLKPKCILIHIFELFFVIWKYNMIFFNFWETWPYAWKQNNFFYVLTKTRYFNTGFVSLQYTNTNQYWSKYSKIFVENHRFFFEIIFEEIIFLGWAQPGPYGWAGPSHPCGLTQLSHARVKFYACMEQCEGNYITFALFILRFCR